MRRLFWLFLTAVSLWGQGTTPSTGVWTQINAISGNTNGYPVYTIGQFDKADWINSRHCYALWGEYKSATFSETNEAMLCYSYAENFPHMIEQSTNSHSTNRPGTGHQWGDSSYDSNHDIYYWFAQPTNGVMDPFWRMRAFDMAAQVDYDLPVFTIGATMTRPWYGSGSTLSGYISYDTTNNVLIVFPETSIATAKFDVCSFVTMTCTTYTPGTGPAATQATSNLRFNPDDGYTYWLGGGATTIWRVNGASPSSGWSSFSNATCSGADCVFTSGSIGHPPARSAAGFAYSTLDHLWLMVSGVISSTQVKDVWTFDPAAGGGAGAYVEVCGPGGPTCSTAFPNFSTQREGDRLVYNPDANVFMVQDDASNMWVFPYTAATAGYGATPPAYGVPTATAPVVGPLNRTTPQTPPSSGNNETGAFDLSVDASGGTIYLSHVEPTVPTGTGGCSFPIPYIWSSTVSGNWLPTGTQATACAAIQNPANNQPSGHVYHALVGSTEYEVHEKRNWAGLSTNNKAQIQTYAAGTWSGGDIGCATATCFSVGSITPQNTPRGIVNANGTPMVITLEEIAASSQTQDVFVMNCASVPCTSLTGTTPLNYLTGTGVYVSDASLNTDPTGKMMACWVEEVNNSSTRTTMTATPQLKCKYWNGSSMSVVGTGANNGSLNQSLSGWARSPSVVYAGGWYVAYTEQAPTGLQKVYTLSCPTNGSACSLVGGALNNNATTGRAHQVKLASDGTSLFAAWTEQSASGQRVLGYLSKWSGSAWTSIASGFAANTGAGTVIDIGAASPSSGTVAVGWTESTWGNLPQVYYQTFAAQVVSIPIEVRELVCSGCPTTGIARTNEHVQFGIPLADSAGVGSTSTLGLTGASAGQFKVIGSWPSGNIKWLGVNAIIPSVSAGGTATVTLTNSGAGNFGGSNLATDNGSTITVATGTATFTIKKANYNVVDVVDVGSTHVVLTGASTGIALLGPDPTATYPASVTCLPTTGGSACATPFTSANDSSSTCSVVDNGPAFASLKCSGTLKDAGGTHSYMDYTQWLTFVDGKNYVKAVTMLRNADYGTSSTFATASKGYQSLELRINPNISGTLSYAIANNAGNTTGTLNQAGGTDYAYLYQAESNQMKNSNWCTGFPGCIVPSSLTGFAIVANGTASLTGTASQYPTGWADISDASGVGVEIGQYYLAGYGNKSLEFRGGGTDVRIGLWAAENNTTSTSTLTANAPYYLRWPQWNTQESWFVFHASALASETNEHLMRQHPLTARASSSTYYNSTGTIPYPLVDPTEESAYYAAVAATASPSVTPYSISDLAFGTTSNSDSSCSTTVCIWRYWRWPQTGVGNQTEFRRAHLYAFLQRGFTGAAIYAKNWYRMAGDNAWPHSDGFNWRDKASGEKQYYDFPIATSDNGSLALSNQIENDGEHANMQGIFTYYYLTGDESFKDYLDAYADAFLNSAANNIYTTSGGSPAIWNSRALGNVFMSLAATFDYLNMTGQSTDAASILTKGSTLATNHIFQDLCAYAGYPTGCTTDPNDNVPQLGISKVRGIQNSWKDTSVSLAAGCSGTIPASQRTQKSFMVGRMLEGLWEWSQTAGPANLTYYNQLRDYMYGTVQWALGEMQADNGSPSSFTGNGWRYAQAQDYANGCNTTVDWQVKNTHPGIYFLVKNAYDGSTNWKRNFDFLLQNDLRDGTLDELYHYVVGANIYAVNHPLATTLQTLPLTGFTDNGGGSYTLNWTTPAGTSSLRVKSSPKQIVDWIGYDAGVGNFTGNPATTANWFAATDAPGIPVPVTGAQTMTVTGLASGLTSLNFSVRAMAPAATAASPSFCMGCKFTGATRH
jgi:hypothetical protein